MTEGDKDILVRPGGMVEINAEAIARIIVGNCHCPVGSAEAAADLIIDYVIGVVLASGSAEDITIPPGGVQ